MYMYIKKYFIRGFTNIHTSRCKSRLQQKSSGQFMYSDESVIESDATHSHTDFSDSEKDTKTTGCMKS